MIHPTDSAHPDALDLGARGCAYPETDLLSPGEERDLARAAQAGSETARRKMIEANLRLVIANARRYHTRGLAFEDLVQEGILGLIAAVQRFDPERGYRFSTYATHWIRQAIGRAVDNHGRLIRLPTHVFETARRLERARGALIRRLGRLPTAEELAQESAVPLSRVEEIQLSMQEPLSLDTLLGDEETPLADMLLDQAAPNPEALTLGNRRRESLERILRVLAPRERLVIEQRYGFLDGRVRSLLEVGEQLRMSREGVRQIEVRALRKLRAAARSWRHEERPVDAGR